MPETYSLDRPVAITCPECGGALRMQKVGPVAQFRCHIGHLFTAQAVLAAHFNIVEIKLAAAVMALNERAELCRELDDTDGDGDGSLRRARDEALERAKVIIGLLESEWAHSLTASDPS
jgi:two-component system chemotaxis response regulator CheB